VRTTDDETYRGKNQSDLKEFYYKIQQEREEQGNVAVFRKARGIYAENLSESEDPIERGQAVEIAEELVRDAPDDVSSLVGLTRVVLRVKPNLEGLHRLRELAQQSEDGFLCVAATLPQVVGDTLGATLNSLEQHRQDADIMAILSELDAICAIADHRSFGPRSVLYVPLLMYGAECYTWMGNQRTQIASWEKALSLYERDLNLLDVTEPTEQEMHQQVKEKKANIHSVIGVKSHEIGKSMVGITHLRKAVELTPYAEHCWLALGTIQLLNKDAEGIYSLQRAAELGSLEALQLLRQMS
jgi:tetratricopeptide (TPR) repeat protein